MCPFLVSFRQITLLGSRWRDDAAQDLNSEMCGTFLLSGRILDLRWTRPFCIYVVFSFVEEEIPDTALLFFGEEDSFRVNLSSGLKTTQGGPALYRSSSQRERRAALRGVPEVSEAMCILGPFPRHRRPFWLVVTLRSATV